MVVIMRGCSKVTQHCLIFDPLRHQIVSFNLISLKMKHRRPAVPQASRLSETSILVWTRSPFVMMCRRVLAASSRLAWPPCNFAEAAQVCLR